MSFGALRHHILNDSFISEIRDFLADGALPSGRLELRIAERSYVTQDVAVWRSLSELGVRLIVDEVARKMSSFDLLTRVPLCGLQLDRSWATALERSLSAGLRAPTTAAVTAGFRNGNWSAAAGSGTPCRAQASRIPRARASTAPGAGA